MKWFAVITAIAALQFVSVISAPSTVLKRASVSDVVTVGFATLNGGFEFIDHLYLCVALTWR